MSDDDDNPFTQTAQFGESMPDQPAPDAPALVFGQYGHWGQCYRRNRAAGGINPHPAEQDVAGNPVLHLGHEREEHDAFGAQSLDQVSFIGTAESCFVD